MGWSTFQGVQGVVQLVAVAVDALQSALCDVLGDVDSVHQLVVILQRGTTRRSTCNPPDEALNAFTSSTVLPDVCVFTSV